MSETESFYDGLWESWVWAHGPSLSRLLMGRVKRFGLPLSYMVVGPWYTPMKGTDFVPDSVGLTIEGHEIK